MMMLNLGYFLMLIVCLIGFFTEKWDEDDTVNIVIYLNIVIYDVYLYDHTTINTNKLVDQTHLTKIKSKSSPSTSPIITWFTTYESTIQSKGHLFSYHWYIQ